MIIEKLIIDNFGLYGGRHTLDLTVRDPARPVVLIGGLNGAGKTTILNAIQLVLYGKRARVSNRGGGTFDQYLERSLHTAANVTQGSLALEFVRWEDRDYQSYFVRRHWEIEESGIIEKLTVLKNGSLDRVLTESWAEFIEEIIPNEIAGLFLFDGEQIEGFADPARSKQLLNKAINSLLGLDLVSRLQTDLVTFERKKRIESKSDSELAELHNIEQQLRELEKGRNALVDARAHKQTEHDRKRLELERAEDAYRQGGGLLFDHREEIEAERSGVIKAIHEIEERFRSVAEGAAPLMMVQPLLDQVWEQHEEENRSFRDNIVSEVLEERDLQLLEYLKQANVGFEAQAEIRKYFEKDRETRALSLTQDRYLELSPECIADLRHLRTREFTALSTQISEMKARYDALQNKLIEVDRKLAAIPAGEFIRGLIEKRDRAKEAFDIAARELEVSREPIERAQRELEQLQIQYSRLLESTASERLATEDSERLVEHSANVRATMDKFRERVAAQHTGRLADLILDSFKKLLRKQSLVESLRIDPATFDVNLEDTFGNEVLPERLSAGERQLLAVSMLWGLARAAGFPLPVIVDTPLGRLDGSHRDNVVKYYYPEASHQVILLSTNKEIDAELFAQLEPSIGKCYLLEFNDERRSTEIKEGYFEDLWQSNTLNSLSKKKTSSSN